MAYIYILTWDDGVSATCCATRTAAALFCFCGSLLLFTSLFSDGLIVSFEFLPATFVWIIISSPWTRFWCPSREWLRSTLLSSPLRAWTIGVDAITTSCFFFCSSSFFVQARVRGREGASTFSGRNCCQLGLFSDKRLMLTGTVSTSAASPGFFPRLGFPLGMRKHR